MTAIDPAALEALAATWEDACDRADDQGVYTKQAVRECAAQLRALAAAQQPAVDDVQSAWNAWIGARPQIVSTGALEVAFKAGAALRSTVAQGDAKDAARYRWLRVQPDPTNKFDCKRRVSFRVEDWAKTLDPKARNNCWSSQKLSGDAMDAEIDAAMTASTPKGEMK